MVCPATGGRRILTGLPMRTYPTPATGFHVGRTLRCECIHKPASERRRCSICYWTPVMAERAMEGCMGVDRNSVGNVAVFADPQNGKVQHLGFNPARFKPNFRQRRAKLQSQGKCRTLRALRKKQARRTKQENHIVSKQIVSYAATHRRVIAVENLEGARKPKSKSKAMLIAPHGRSTNGCNSSGTKRLYEAYPLSR
jgi:transposase